MHAGLGKPLSHQGKWAAIIEAAATLGGDAVVDEATAAALKLDRQLALRHLQRLPSSQVQMVALGDLTSSVCSLPGLVCNPVHRLF